ncbi:RluA family pseudouridine synthase [Azovibrio restrictus]|uniref:RluA family pseudouridine synthase n=1 Tax=Azovibrio restrictus TaxID=146938 RepID=UPI0026EE3836|nr:RluA family pseudouridine synthase [Azovibrio restrictus]
MPETGKNSVTYVVVGEEDQGQRLDNFLIRLCKGVPKSHLYRVLRSGEVRVNKKRCDATWRIQAGDQIRVPPMRLAERSRSGAEDAAKERVCLPVVYEDEALLAIDKPAGIAVHGGSGVSFGVIESLRQQRPQARFLELAHRLDRETSGLLLIGKKRSALNALHDMFREAGQVADKRYLMLVKGRWMNPLQQVKLPLHKYLLESGERRVRVAPEGKPSHTVFRLLARWQRFSLLEGQLKTGRTHQLRVHLAHLGYPILGDEKYGDFALNKSLQKEGLKRMALHARSMDFPHPLEARRLHLVAPLPGALRQFIACLDAREPRDYSAENLAELLAEPELPPSA